MKYGKTRTAYAITLDYGKKHEILLGLIYDFKSDAENYFKKNLYAPEYKIKKVQITEL